MQKKKKKMFFSKITFAKLIFALLRVANQYFIGYRFCKDEGCLRPRAHVGRERKNSILVSLREQMFPLASLVQDKNGVRELIPAGEREREGEGQPNYSTLLLENNKLEC